MTETALPSDRSGWFSIFSSTLTAVVVGFASTILVIMEAARNVGASPTQQASWAAALCFGMAITSLILSWRYKMPMITAWSTPGAVLIATSGGGITYANALGAFVVAGLLMVVAGLIKPLEKAIEKIPAPVAAAMLAGVLLRYTLGVPGAAMAMPWAVLPLIIVFFGLRLSYPLYAVPVVVVLGVALAAFGGGFAGDCCSFGITTLEWTTPSFDWQTILSIGVPLFLVTMASQNLPGFAVLRGSGYQPPTQPILAVTGAASLGTAFLGAHTSNLAAISAALCTGPDAHPDPAQRWKTGPFYALFWGLIALFGASLVGLFGALPPALLATVAGTALLGSTAGALGIALAGEQDRLAAAGTLAVTVSGVTLMGVGSAFWGLVFGLLILGVDRFAKAKR